MNPCKQLSATEVIEHISNRKSSFPTLRLKQKDGMIECVNIGGEFLNFCSGYFTSDDIFHIISYFTNNERQQLFWNYLQWEGCVLKIQNVQIIGYDMQVYFTLAFWIKVRNLKSVTINDEIVYIL